ncbi:MAG: hypothetical protein ACREFE_15765 [Limisphaerales bacterium]
MNDSETNQMSGEAHGEFSDQIAALQRQTFILLLALIVVSGTLTVYLYRQASLTRNDIKNIKPQATKLIGAYKQNLAGITNFVQQLEGFGRTHPDFLPVLKRHGIVPVPAAPVKK